MHPTAEHPKGRQVVKTFYGGKREVKRNVTDWEREVQAAAPTAVGLTVAELLALWQEAKAPAWQPTTVRDHRNRSEKIEAALGTARVSDLDPLRIDR